MCNHIDAWNIPLISSPFSRSYMQHRARRNCPCPHICVCVDTRFSLPTGWGDWTDEHTHWCVKYKRNSQSASLLWPFWVLLSFGNASTATESMQKSRSVPDWEGLQHGSTLIGSALSPLQAVQDLLLRACSHECFFCLYINAWAPYFPTLWIFLGHHLLCPVFLPVFIPFVHSLTILSPLFPPGQLRGHTDHCAFKSCEAQGSYQGAAVLQHARAWEGNTAPKFRRHGNKDFHLLPKASKERDMLSVISVGLISQSSMTVALMLITIKRLRGWSYRLQNIHIP